MFMLVLLRYRDDPIAVKGAISDLYGAADEDQKLEIQKKADFKQSRQKILRLSSMYAMQNGIAESVNVTETAAQMLDGFRDRGAQAAH